MKKAGLFLTILLCLGCMHQPGEINIAVTLSDSNRTLSINGFDKAIIADIGRDTDKGAWQSVLPIYKMPADTGLKDYQPAQPGQYMVKDSLVIFKPDTLFKKGQLYFLRYYQHNTDDGAWQYIRSKKRPGTLHYRDLIFKY